MHIPKPQRKPMTISLTLGERQQLASFACTKGMDEVVRGSQLSRSRWYAIAKRFDGNIYELHADVWRRAEELHRENWEHTQKHRDGYFMINGRYFVTPNFQEFHRNNRQYREAIIEEAQRDLHFSQRWSDLYNIASAIDYP